MSLIIIRNNVGVGKFNLNSTIIRLIKSVKGVELMKYNNRLSQVANNIINNPCNSSFNEITITIKVTLKLFPLLSLLNIPLSQHLITTILL